MMRLTCLALAAITMVVISCGDKDVQTDDAAAGIAPAEVMGFPLTGPGQILTSTGVTFDTAISADGNGSVRIDTEDSTTVRLFEIDSVDLESALLVYEAKVRCENLQGDAYLDMLCTFPEMGEFFSRNLHRPISGTVGWVTMETPFRLLEGQNPERVSLNIVVTGPGTVWIDDIRLIRRPLEAD
jgi:hypothetical protein